MYHGVTSVKAVEGHHLIIGFDNGETRMFDVTPLLTTGRFGELRAQDLFGKVKVSFDTVSWDNGLDLDPEYLYAQSRKLADCPQQNRRRTFSTGIAAERHGEYKTHAQKKRVSKTARVS